MLLLGGDLAYADGWGPRWDSFGRMLEPLAARYFLREQRSDGQPIDPVARFHLGNGAILDRLNPAGNLSARGLDEALGLMVNYRYALSDIEKNHEAYTGESEVAASGQVRKALKG